MALLYDPTRGMRPLPPARETVAHDSWERRRLEGLAETHDLARQEQRRRSDMALARGLVTASFVSPLTSIFTMPLAKDLASQYEGGAEEIDQQVRDALTMGVVFGGMRAPSASYPLRRSGAMDRRISLLDSIDAAKNVSILAERGAQRFGSAAQQIRLVPNFPRVQGAGKALREFLKTSVKNHKLAYTGGGITLGVAAGTTLHQYNAAVREQQKEAEEAFKRNAQISMARTTLAKLQQSLNEDPNRVFSSSKVFSDTMVKGAQAVAGIYALGGFTADQAMETYSGWYEAVRKANPEAFRVRERELRSGGILVDPETFIRDYGIGESTKKEGQ